jgi:hypothetical protein
VKTSEREEREEREREREETESRESEKREKIEEGREREESRENRAPSTCVIPRQTTNKPKNRASTEDQRTRVPSHHQNTLYSSAR